MKIETSKRVYPCGVCGAPEAYRAIGNVPEHAHYCETCYPLLSIDTKQHLYRVSESAS